MVILKKPPKPSLVLPSTQSTYVRFYSKLNRTIEQKDTTKAVSLYKRACEIYGLEEKDIYGSETFKNAINFMIQSKQYMEALDLMREQIKILKKRNQIHQIVKIQLSMIIINLCNNDEVAAGKDFNTFQETSEFRNSEEGKIGGELLEAFEKHDIQLFQKCSNSQIFHFLDTQIQRALQNLASSFQSGEINLC
eukprot:TRINITY_DN342_c0_g1_i1.p1 TRINITY_DN342_c0_g1~~TRINITY_DN342_c0_g1_i1.p1  ORF type:complete len:193 (+),score=17.95 TRINITY_DN342_c0_g1_i1:440-1018(+)